MKRVHCVLESRSQFPIPCRTLVAASRFMPRSVSMGRESANAAPKRLTNIQPVRREFSEVGMIINYLENTLPTRTSPNDRRPGALRHRLPKSALLNVKRDCFASALDLVIDSAATIRRISVLERFRRLLQATAIRLRNRRQIN